MSSLTASTLLIRASFTSMPPADQVGGHRLEIQLALAQGHGAQRAKGYAAQEKQSEFDAAVHNSSFCLTVRMTNADGRYSPNEDNTSRPPPHGTATEARLDKTVPTEEG